MKYTVRVDVSGRQAQLVDVEADTREAAAAEALSLVEDKFRTHNRKITLAGIDDREYMGKCDETGRIVLEGDDCHFTADEDCVFILDRLVETAELQSEQRERLATRFTAVTG